MRTHSFIPSHYHGSFGAHRAVLRIQSGDRINTSTVDAAGYDGNGRHAAERGNPLTGPFWVEDAQPGDSITVGIERITPNRTSGFSCGTLAPGVLDPAFAVELGRDHSEASVNWTIDACRSTVSTVRPTSGLDSLELPLEPMLGCIGVSPPRQQAISTATSAEHGGNMDYRGIAAGISLHLPVFEPGALLFIGDAHALQGDGEISGTGIEISADVSLIVELRKGNTIGWPRGESDKHLFTLGNARPLDQALQHATSEMMRWLMSEHGLGATAAAVLLSQCVRYDVGNVYDPAYTMVCRLSKDILEKVR